MEALDLRHVPVVDNHCHGIWRSQDFEDPVSWRRAFTESADPRIPREHVASTAFYRRLIRTLSGFFDCEPGEEAVLTARTGRDVTELVGTMLRSANIENLLLDTGYPSPEEVLPGTELGELGGCLVEPMLRLEPLMERLLTEHGSLTAVREALTVALDDVRGQGYVALKSIVAYRTGLNVGEWTEEEAEASFREFRRVAAEGSTRLAHKPLLDTFCTWPLPRRSSRRFRSSFTLDTAT